MKKIVKSVFIEAPVGKVYDYLIEPTNLPEYWPNVVNVSEVKALPNGGYSTSWVYKAGPFRFKGTGVTADCARNQFILDHIKGGVDSIQKWVLSPKDHGTVATFEVEFAIRVPVIGGLLDKIVERLSQQDGEKIMTLLKAKMEQRPGTARSA